MRPSSGVQYKKAKVNFFLSIVRELCWDYVKSLQASKLLILHKALGKHEIQVLADVRKREWVDILCRSMVTRV